MQILEKILQLESEIQNQLSGDTPGYCFMVEYDRLADNFRTSVAESKPLLTQPKLAALFHQSMESVSHGSVTSTPTPAQKSNAPIPITIDSDGDDLPSSALRVLPNSERLVKKRVNGSTPQETPQKRARMSDIPLHTPKKPATKGKMFIYFIHESDADNS